MLPLKSGADLYNQEAARMRLHNLGADPTEVGAGLIYYNTSSGLSTSQKIRFHTGTAWKTLAFAEDLDVASNADFLALKSKVDAFLEGGVDSDGVLENLKEIQAFLDNYSSATDLSEILDTKLDKAGGTISGTTLRPLIVETTASAIETQFKTKDGVRIYLGWNDIDGIYLQECVSQKYIGIKTDGTPYYYNGARNTLIHSGNIGEYNAGSASTLRGIYKDTFDANQCYNTSCLIKFYSGFSPDSANIPDSNSWFNGLLEIGLNASGAVSQFFFVADQPLYYRASNTSAWKQIAFTDSDITGNAGSANALTLEAVGDLNSATANRAFYSHFQALNKPATNYATGFTLKNESVGYVHQLSFDTNSKLYTRVHNGTEWSAWKTIAFTDSDITGYAAGLKHSNGTVAATVASSGKVDFSANISMALNKSILDPSGRSVFMIDGNNSPQIGFDTCGSYSTYINGKDVYIRYGSSRTTGIILNSSGNVLIGRAEEDGSGAKLQVNGNIALGSGNDASIIMKRGYYNRFIASEVGGRFAWQVNGSGTDAMALDHYGRLIIGSASNIDGTSKLQVVGDLHVTGNIIADGEVAAGGAGTEGGNAGGGSGAFYSTTIATQTTSKAIAHNLGTEDIVVSIYEKNGTSGNWEMILTDVEIEDANNIVVSFGSATNVEHKVVIMGAVA